MGEESISELVGLVKIVLGILVAIIILRFMYEIVCAKTLAAGWFIC